jgi:hypothetical protein
MRLRDQLTGNMADDCEALKTMEAAHNFGK